MLSRGTHQGQDVIWLELDEYRIPSPPIPTHRSAYLNGDVTDVRAQKFKHTDLPNAKTYNGWNEKKKQELEDREWKRRKEGVWFFNCGEPTYLTGNHYYYLNYHRYAREQKPEYRQANLEFFWVWKYCLEAENCLGLYLHTRRRDGKTSRTASIGLEAATRIKGFRFGMQSKIGRPSASVSIFQNEIVRPLKALRDCPWFMPSLKGKIDPDNNLKFGAPSTTAKDAQAAPTGLDDLGSEIMWFESPPNAIDSDSLGMYFRDEVAKEQAYNSYKAWITALPQLMPNGYKEGMGICATTTDIEEDDDEEDGEVNKKKVRNRTAVKRAKQFWGNSNHTKLKKAGQYTPSRMWRLFTPAYKGFKVDEYGRDTPAGKQHFLDIRASLSGVALLNEKRANPFTIEEAMEEPANPDCAFNEDHIRHNIKALEDYELITGKPLVKRYDLVWEDEVTMKPPVRALPNEKGAWEFSWLPPVEEQNQVLRLGFITNDKGERWPKWKPQREDDTSIGCDPILRKLSSLNDPTRASNFAALVFRPYNPWNERRIGQPTYWPTESFIGRYNDRPENPHTCYKEMMKACYFFGTRLHAETQSNAGQQKFFEDHGFEEFLAERPLLTQNESNRNQQAPGTAASPTNTNRWVGLIAQFVIDYVGSAETVNSKGEYGINDRGQPYDFRRMPFAAVLRDNKDFKPEDTRVYDDTVAEGYALSHAYRRTRQIAYGAGEDGEQGIDASVFNPEEYFSRR